MAILQAVVMSQILQNQPNEFSLFQPIESSQMVLTESVHCLAVQAFMKFNNLDVKVYNKSNAEFMCPSGKVPMLKCGPVCVSQPIPIFTLLRQKGVVTLQELSAQNKLDEEAYISMIENILTPAEIYITWSENDTYNEITKKRYGSPHKWPLNHILSWRKRSEMMYFLNIIGWKKSIKSKNKLLDDVNTCCMTLAQKLGQNTYFFGNNPSALDAIVFGHLYSILTTRLPDNRLAETVRKFETLVKFCQQIDRSYFNLDNFEMCCQNSTDCSMSE